MFMALGIIGMLALIIGIVMLIINAIRKNKLRIWGIIATVGLIFFIVGVSLSGPATPTPAPSPASAPEREKVVMPNYSILDEDVYDTPGKTQVALNILVSGEISEPGLGALLNQLYSSIATRSGFKYHDFPTNIYIYAYTSREKAESGMGLWIAMLAKDYDNVKPTISINERQIALLDAKPEQKFGLSEAERQQIWNEIVKSEDRARREAEQEFPDPDPLDPNYSQSLFMEQFEKQIELQRTLDEKYKNELAEKYGLTRDQLAEIAGEGLTKDWPFPPPPSETLAPAPAPTPAPAPAPAPAPESYPMVKIGSYPEGSAERAFAEFLTAWKDKDWDRMAEFSQITWRSAQNNPAEMLNSAYGFKDLLGAEIIKKSDVSDVMVDITATIYYRIAQVEKKSITARVIRETAPNKPSSEGKWGVNPISTLREE